MNITGVRKKRLVWLIFQKKYMFRDIIFVVVYQGNVKDWQYWIMWLHFLSSWTSHQKRVFNNRWDVRWITMRRNKSLSFISSLLCSWCKCNVEVLNHLLESGRLGLVALLSNRGWNLIIRYPRLTLVCLTIENYFSSLTKIRHLVSSLLWYEDYHWLSICELCQHYYPPLRPGMSLDQDYS